MGEHKNILKYNNQLVMYGSDYLRYEPPPLQPTYPTNGLIVRYAFEDNLYDSANSYNLTSAGTAAYATGKVGKGHSFNGSNEAYTTDATIRAIFDYNYAYTIALWFNSADTTYRILFGCDGTNSPPYKRTWIDRRGSTEIHFERFRSYSMGGVGAVGVSITGLSLSVGTWYHIVVVYTGSDAVFYLNGTNIPYTPNTGWNTYKGASMDSGGTLQTTIGGNRQNNVSQFLGIIDQVYIYNRALTQSEVSQLYNGGAGV